MNDNPASQTIVIFSDILVSLMLVDEYNYLNN